MKLSLKKKWKGRQQVPYAICQLIYRGQFSVQNKRVHMVIMFIDIRNFTRFASARHPEEIIQYQNIFFSLVVDSVSKYHGAVHQFLGDGCMVTFNASEGIDAAAQNAVNAAMKLLGMLEQLVEHRALPTTTIGVGIHTGEVVAGNIGIHDRGQYVVTGSAVILASRIEQLNKQFDSKVLVSEEVARIIKGVKTERFGPVDLKGWHKAISVYKVA